MCGWVGGCLACCGPVAVLRVPVCRCAEWSGVPVYKGSRVSRWAARPSHKPLHLGHRLSAEGVLVDPRKAQSIVKWATPTLRRASLHTTGQLLPPFRGGLRQGRRGKPDGPAVAARLCGPAPTPRRRRATRTQRVSRSSSLASVATHPRRRCSPPSALGGRTFDAPQRQPSPTSRRAAHTPPHG